jgi:hypothetical protein
MHHKEEIEGPADADYSAPLFSFVNPGRQNASQGIEEDI